MISILSSITFPPMRLYIKNTPAVASRVLHRDINAPACNGNFHYRSVIGKLNYLKKGSRSDITRYLQATRDKGLIIDPEAEKALEVYADADFVGSYNKSIAPFDASTAKSRSGYVIKFCESSIVWTSKLQTCVALSSCESEYYALSQALREAIPIMDLLEEIRSFGLAKDYIPAKVYCKAFEDNSGALEMATVHKIRPRTKHINNVYHHFHEHVRTGKITVHAISTKEQFADILYIY